MAVSPEDRERIVALRLEGRSVRETAAMVGHSPTTVTKYWGEYLAESAADNRGDLDLLREHLAQRLETVAYEARTVATELAGAGDHRGALPFMREERAALVALADLFGLRRVAAVPAPTPWGATAGVRDVEADREALKKRLVAYCDQYNAGKPDTRLEVRERKGGADPREELAAYLVGLVEPPDSEGDAA